MKNTVEFIDPDGTNISIHYSSQWNKFNISITDSYGRGTYSIAMDYDQFRSLFKDAESMVFENMDLVKRHD